MIYSLKQANKLITNFSLLLLLSSCVVFGKSNFYVPKNRDYLKKPLVRNTIYYTEFPFTKNTHIYIELPMKIGDGKTFEIMFPPLMWWRNNIKLKENDLSFTIEIYNKKSSLTEEEIKSMVFKLKTDNGKTYSSKLKIYNRWTQFTKKENYEIKSYYFTFPVKIKDIKEGTLIIKYNGIIKELPFEREMLWYDGNF